MVCYEHDRLLLPAQSYVYESFVLLQFEEIKAALYVLLAIDVDKEFCLPDSYD